MSFVLNHCRWMQPRWPLVVSPAESQKTIQQCNQFLEIGEYEKAIESYTEFISIQGNDTDALVGRASAYFETSQLDKAMADLEMALQADANDLDALFNRGAVF